MTLLFFYLFLAIGVSFLCSILESVILSITPSFIQSLKLNDKKYGAVLEKLKVDIDRPLSAILSLNTIAHTVGASGVGAQASKIFGDAYFGIISGILTLMILIFSEIIPKTIGANYWKKLAAITAYTLPVLIIITYPLVLLSQVMSKILSSSSSQPSTTREEVAALTHLGEKEGVFEQSESRIIYNLIRFRKIMAKHIMTPRTVVYAVREDTLLKDVLGNKEMMRFSRIPIYEDRIDNVSGYILKHQLLEKLAEDQHTMQLKDIRREITMVSDNTPVPLIFENLIKDREQIAMVVDEFGGMAGIVTMEDIIETLLGTEIQDELDHVEDMQEWARRKWKSRASRMGILPEEEQSREEEQSPDKDDSEEENLK